jgi:hypothetical protein
MDIAALYREHGPAILAACRRATGDDARAAELAPRVFAHVQRQLGDEALMLRAAYRMAAELPGPRLLRDPAPPTEAELARARERFTREVYGKTVGLVVRDQRAPRVLRWLPFVAPVWVALAFAAMFPASKNPRAPSSLELYSGERLLRPGMLVRRGETLRAVVAPGDYEFVTVYVGPRVVSHIDHRPRERVVMPVVVDEAPLRVRAAFSESQRGLPQRVTGIELNVE